MPEINYAERENRDPATYSLDECRQYGNTIRAYGWSRMAHREWTPEQRRAYYAGFHQDDEAKILKSLASAASYYGEIQE